MTTFLHDGDEYTGDDFAFDLLAGIYAEADRIRADQGEDAFRAYLDDTVMMVGATLLDLERHYSDAEIQAQIHMRMYTDQGFTHISFGEDGNP